MQVLKEDFAVLDLLIKSCDIDFGILRESSIKLKSAMA